MSRILGTAMPAAVDFLHQQALQARTRIVWIRLYRCLGRKHACKALARTARESDCSEDMLSSMVSSRVSLPLQHILLLGSLPRHGYIWHVSVTKQSA